MRYIKDKEELVMKKLICLFVIVVMSAIGVSAYPDSLWMNQDGETPGSLFTDQKASKIGDIITVLVVDQATATQTATGSRDRSSSISGEVKSWSTPALYDKNNIFSGIHTIVQNGANKPIWELESANEFSGSGKYAGNYSIRGQITTRVREVLPNKNMIVEGTSEVFVNAEKNTVTISGIVRPEDVTVNNTVLSTKLADAKVRMVGNGPVNDKTKRGVLETVMDWLWPF